MKLFKIILIITLISSFIVGSTRIVDGSLVSDSNTHWNAIVSLRVNTTHICGGTLIAPSWVITAGHCVLTANNTLVPIAKMTIANGSYQLYNYNMKSYSVESIIVHPQYNATTHNNDIALIELTQSIALDSFPVINKEITVKSGQEAWVAGWGILFLGSDILASRLREVSVPILNFSTCNSYFAYDGDLTDNMVCAGYLLGGADTCVGDSGGPLLRYEVEQETLIGITSWGRGCGEFAHPGIYTKIENYYDWIFTNTQEAIDTPIVVESSKSGDITKLYVATFNRAPDASGIEYWLQSGLSLEEIAKSFFDQTETQDLYPASSQVGLFVQSVYSNLFNREPDTEGWIYWVDAINSGSISRSLFILAVINGAKDDDSIILGNKQKVGEYFASKGLNDTEDAKIVISGITSSSESVEESMTIIDSLTP